MAARETEAAQRSVEYVRQGHSYARAASMAGVARSTVQAACLRAGVRSTVPAGRPRKVQCGNVAK